MSMLNVRCCCDPGKIIGTINVVGGFRVGKVRAMKMRSIHEMISDHADIVEITIREYRSDDGVRSKLAVDSEGRSIEFWRTLSGFKPA